MGQDGGKIQVLSGKSVSRSSGFQSSFTNKKQQDIWHSDSELVQMLQQLRVGLSL